MPKNKEPFLETLNNIPNDIVSYGYKIRFHIGQTVYLKMDKEQNPRMVTGILLRQSGSVIYALKNDSAETWHYDVEITDQKDQSMYCDSCGTKLREDEKFAGICEECGLDFAI